MSTPVPPPHRSSHSTARRRAASAAAGPRAAALRDSEPPHVAGAAPCLCAMCHLRPTRFPRRLDGRIVLPDPLIAVRDEDRAEPEQRVRAGSFAENYAGGERAGDSVGEDRGEGPSTHTRAGTGGQWHGDTESHAWLERAAGRAGAGPVPSVGPGTPGDVRDAAHARCTDGRQAVGGEHS